jgi:hypothetical protein
MDTKISQLPLLATVSGNEDIPVVVNGQNQRVKASSLQTQTGGATTIAGITGLQTALDAKATPADIATAVAGKANTAHSHAVADVTGLQAALDSKTDLAAVDARIEAVIGAAPTALDTLAEIAAQLTTDESAVAALTTTVAGKAAAVHSHAIADTTGLQEALDIKADLLPMTAALADKADNAHTHTVADTTGLQTALDAKAGVTHAHDIEDVTGLQAALDAKTDLVAVDARIQAVVGAAPAALDTLAEIATQLQSDESAVAALTTTVAGKAATVHAHAIADVTDLQTTLDTKADLIPIMASLADKADNAHTHALADVTGLQTALDSKSDTSHAHAIADVTGLQAGLNGKAASVHTHAYADISDLSAFLAYVKRNTVWPILAATVSNVTANSVDVQVTISNTNGYYMESVSVKSAADIGQTEFTASAGVAFVNGTYVYNYTVTGLTASTEYNIVSFITDNNNDVDDRIATTAANVITTLAA